MNRFCTASTLRLGLVLASLGVGLGCGSDTTGPTPIAPAHLYKSLSLNHHAITLALTAPYDTIQLATTPRSATGVPLADTGTVRYTIDISNDNCGCQSVTVSQTGLVTADSVDQNVNVIATRTIGNITQADTAVVTVNDVSPVPVFAGFVLQGVPGDSVKLSVLGADGDQFTGLFNHFVDAYDNMGNIISNSIQVAQIIRNPKIANIAGWPYEWMQPNHPGRTWIVEDAMVYGKTVIDSFPVTVGWPTASPIDVYTSTPFPPKTPFGYFALRDDTVAVGGTVFWRNKQASLPIDIVFDDPGAASAPDSVFINQTFGLVGLVGQGDIPAIAPLSTDTTIITVQRCCGQSPRVDTSVTQTVHVGARSFPTAGTYLYHSSVYGTRGVIHVLPEFEVP